MSDNINQKLCSKYLLKNHYDSLVKPFSNNGKIKPNLRSWFYADELASIYNIPSPNLTTRTYVAVVSFGGGLYGNLSGGILTNGDVQKYWQAIGISSSNMPTVMVIPIIWMVINTQNHSCMKRATHRNSLTMLDQK